MRNQTIFFLKAYALLLLVALTLTVEVVAQSFLSQAPLPQKNTVTQEELAFDALKASQEPETVDVLVSDQSPLFLTPSFLSKINQLIENANYRPALFQLLEYPVQFEAEITAEEEFDLLEHRLFLLIKVHYLLNESQESLSLAQDFLENYSNGLNYYQVYYYYAATLNALKQPLEYTSLITEQFFEALTLDKSTKLRSYLVQDALNKKDFYTALSFLEDDFGSFIPSYEQWFSKIVEKIENYEEIENLLISYDTPLISSQLYLRKVQLLIRDYRYLEAYDFTNLLMQSDDFNVQLFGELLSQQEMLDTALKTQPYKIGIILPFSHKRFKSLANQVRDGLELALQDFTMEGKPIQLVFQDSIPKKDKTITSKKARYEQSREHMQDIIQKLVLEEQVIAILGPLTKNNSLLAGEFAEAYRVPILSYSLTEDIGKSLPYLYRFQRSKVREAKTLANYAADYLNAKRFILFYPAGKTGFRSMQAFADQVTSRGGKIVGVSRVQRQQSDFNNSFLSMTGGYRSISEEEELELEQSRERLPPVVDFDAVYAPLPPKTLKIINSFLRLFKADKTWVLAGSAVNVKENQLMDNTRRLRFVDTFAISSERTFLQPFYEAHWRNYNFRPHYDPPTSYTFYGYESLELLTKLLNNPQRHYRESLKRAIDELKDFPVLTGTINAQPNGELSKELKVLKIKRKNTVSVF